METELAQNASARWCILRADETKNSCWHARDHGVVWFVVRAGSYVCANVCIKIVDKFNCIKWNQRVVAESRRRWRVHYNAFEQHMETIRNKVWFVELISDLFECFIARARAWARARARVCVCACLEHVQRHSCARCMNGIYAYIHCACTNCHLFWEPIAVCTPFASHCPHCRLRFSIKARTHGQSPARVVNWTRNGLNFKGNSVPAQFIE